MTTETQETNKSKQEGFVFQSIITFLLHVTIESLLIIFFHLSNWLFKITKQLNSYAQIVMALQMQSKLVN